MRKLVAFWPKTNKNDQKKLLLSGDRVVQRIVELVGSRTNGVWSTQIEVEYGRKFKGETLPEKWPAALERLDASMAKLRVDRPIPGDNGRCIILPNLHHNTSGDDPLTVDTAAVKAVKTPQASPIVVGEFQPQSMGEFLLCLWSYCFT